MNESISGPDLIDPVAENLSYENIRDNSKAMEIVFAGGHFTEEGIKKLSAIKQAMH